MPGARAWVTGSASDSTIPVSPLRKSFAAITFFSLLFSLQLAAETIDPAENGSQHVWSENTGWINAEPRGDGGPGMHVASAWVGGWIWSENLGWISLSCDNTASCSIVDYRVTIDRDGNLFGFAWSENAGWISFSCETTGSCTTVDYSVTVDLGTGELTGVAWPENLGWMSFSCANTASCTTVDFKVGTTVPLPNHLFVDGFESGNTVMWSGIERSP